MSPGKCGEDLISQRSDDMGIIGTFFKYKAFKRGLEFVLSMLRRKYSTGTARQLR